MYWTVASLPDVPAARLPPLASAIRCSARECTSMLSTVTLLRYGFELNVSPACALAGTTKAAHSAAAPRAFHMGLLLHPVIHDLKAARRLPSGTSVCGATTRGLRRPGNPRQCAPMRRLHSYLGERRAARTTVVQCAALAERARGRRAVA